jgi:hypothetical protein
VVQRSHVDASGLRARSDASDVFGFFEPTQDSLEAVHGIGYFPRGDAFDKFVAVIDIENENADAAVLHVVADAGAGDI